MCWSLHDNPGELCGRLAEAGDGGRSESQSSATSRSHNTESESGLGARPHLIPRELRRIDRKVAPQQRRATQWLHTAASLARVIVISGDY